MTVGGQVDLRELAGRLARSRRDRTEATVQSDARTQLLAPGSTRTEGDVQDVELTRNFPTVAGPACRGRSRHLAKERT